MAPPPPPPRSHTDIDPRNRRARTSTTGSGPQTNDDARDFPMSTSAASPTRHRQVENEAIHFNLRRCVASFGAFETGFNLTGKPPNTSFRDGACSYYVDGRRLLEDGRSPRAPDFAVRGWEHSAERARSSTDDRAQIGSDRTPCARCCLGEVARVTVRRATDGNR